MNRTARQFSPEGDPPEIEFDSIESQSPGSATDPKARQTFFQQLRRLRLLEAGAAVYLLGSGVEFAAGKMSRADAWKEFQSKHPDKVGIQYPTMDEVPETQRENIYRARDNQYVARVKDGLLAYQSRMLGAQADPEKLRQKEVRLLQALEGFRPSVYDRWLTKSGLGRMVRTDRPFPVVEFANLSDPNTAGQVETEADAFTPDTVFIDTDPTKEDRIVEVMEHEYLHTTQWGYHGLDRVHYRTETHLTATFNDGQTFYDRFNEGANELLRGKLNAILERQFRPSYVPEIENVQTVESTLGPEKFWRLYSQGAYPSIEHTYNQRRGEGGFNRLFTSKK